MATTEYRITNCIEQGIRIIEENPNIARLSFDLNECKFDELVEVASKAKREYSLTNGKAEFTVQHNWGDSWIFICLKTKPLIVSQMVQEVEE